MGRAVAVTDLGMEAPAVMAEVLVEEAAVDMEEEPVLAVVTAEVLVAEVATEAVLAVEVEVGD